VYSWQNVFTNYGSRSRVEKKVLDGCDIAFVGNEGAKQNLIKKGCSESKIFKVLEVGIDCEMYKPMPEVEKKYDCLFVGRRVPEKGVEIIDQALDRLPDVKMLWVGKGPYQPKHGEVKGYVPEEDLPAIYNSAKVFVYPTIGIPGVYAEQGFYSGLEAMACGLPVISTRNGAIPELVEGCVSVDLVPEEYVDAQCLKDAISFMLSLNLIEHGKQTRQFIVENYSLPVIAKRYAETFRKSE
jgi:glycosyltransferase involved in cell wall biosynthesis